MSCIVCGSKQPTEIYDILFKCPDCGFVWAKADIPPEQLIKFYENDFFCGKEYRNYLEEQGALKKNFKRNLELISRFKRSGNLLEIGCAYGFFLELAQKRYTVTGIDIGENACKYAQEQLKLNVICGDFMKTEFQENYYDIVVSWATLEHLSDPHLYIAKISRLLKRGGIFAWSTVDIESLLAKFQGKKWRQIHPPSHLSYFSEKTAGILLQKNGFKQALVTRLGEYRTVDNCLYIMLALNKKSPFLYQLIKKLKLNKGMFYLNTFDIMYIVAVKIN